MNLRYPEPILNEPITGLPFSTEFICVTSLLGFTCLADLIDLHMNQLLAMPGFDHRLWNEYVAFLEENRIGHYLNNT